MKGTRIHWQIHAFDSLSVRQLYQVLQLRQDVFIFEQQCVYADIDDLDQCAQHVLGIASDTPALVAYCRILPPGVRFEEVAIGRVVTRHSMRRYGYGEQLMRHAMRHCERRFPGVSLRISAQQHLTAFYESLGFVVDSAPYDEDGIPHIEMLFPSQNA